MKYSLLYILQYKLHFVLRKSHVSIVITVNYWKTFKHLVLNLPYTNLNKTIFPTVVASFENAGYLYRTIKFLHNKFIIEIFNSLR